jgi:DNA-binding GntR family transcriptional regulator
MFRKVCLKKHARFGKERIMAFKKISDEVLKEIFPKKLNRHQESERLYSQLKQMILSGKLKKGKRLTYNGIAQEFNVSRGIAHKIISQLKKERLIMSKDKVGLFIA